MATEPAAEDIPPVTAEDNSLVTAPIPHFLAFLGSCCSANACASAACSSFAAIASASLRFLFSSIVCPTSAASAASPSVSTLVVSMPIGYSGIVLP